MTGKWWDKIISSVCPRVACGNEFDMTFEPGTNTTDIFVPPTSQKNHRTGGVAKMAPSQISYPQLVYSPSSAFSGVIGSERTWWPVACATAEATAASGVLMTTSPIDLAPNGPVGS